MLLNKRNADLEMELEELEQVNAKLKEELEKRPLTSKVRQLEKENVMLKDEPEKLPSSLKLLQVKLNSSKPKEVPEKKSIKELSSSDGYDFDGEFLLDSRDSNFFIFQ